MALPFKVPCGTAIPESKSLGIKSRTNIFKLRRFIDPSDQNEWYHNHTPHLKYEFWAMENKLWDYPFNQTSHHQIKTKSLIVANQMWAIIIINIATSEKSQDNFVFCTKCRYLTNISPSPDQGKENFQELNDIKFLRCFLSRRTQFFVKYFNPQCKYFRRNFCSENCLLSISIFLFVSSFSKFGFKWNVPRVHPRETEMPNIRLYMYIKYPGDTQIHCPSTSRFLFSLLTIFLL